MHLKKGDRVVCLVPDGDLADSDGFAAALAKDAESAVPRTVFVIGGPDGLGRGVLEPRRAPFRSGV